MIYRRDIFVETEIPRPKQPENSDNDLSSGVTRPEMSELKRKAPHDEDEQIALFRRVRIKHIAQPAAFADIDHDWVSASQF